MSSKPTNLFSQSSAAKGVKHRFSLWNISRRKHNRNNCQRGKHSFPPNWWPVWRPVWSVHVLPVCWHLHLPEVAIADTRGVPRMLQCESASVQTGKSPHSHHSPPEPDASHTPAVQRYSKAGQPPSQSASFTVLFICTTLATPVSIKSKLKS